MRQIRFTINNFTDALNLTEEEFAALSEEEIEAMKQARYQNWVNFMATEYAEATSEEEKK